MQAGELRFTYVPPRVGGVTVKLEATCDNCENTATNDIAIEPCDVCAGQGEVGNPLQPGSGEKIQRETDWIDSGAHPLSLTRTYRSQGRFTAGLGVAWTHNWSAFLNITGPIVYWPDGTSVVLQSRDASNWSASNLDTLQRSGEGYIYTRASDESRWEFNGAGRPVRITQRNGWTASLVYNSASQLVRVTNAFGRSLQFGYDGSGRLGSVMTPERTQLQYGYDSAGRLSIVSYPDNTTRRYFYEDTRWPLALTGITDEAGNRYANFGYDTQGRATFSEHVGGSQRYSVVYFDDDGTSGSAAGWWQRRRARNAAPPTR